MIARHPNPKASRWVVPVRVGTADTGRIELFNAYGETRELARRDAGHSADEAFPGQHIHVGRSDECLHIGD